MAIESVDRGGIPANPSTPDDAMSATIAWARAGMPKPTTAAGSPEWQAALAAYHAARRHADDMVPIASAADHRYFAAKKIAVDGDLARLEREQAEGGAPYEAAVDALDKATDAVLKTSAPTMTALAEKLDIFRAEDWCGDDRANEFLGIFIADAQRLA